MIDFLTLRQKDLYKLCTKQALHDRRSLTLEINATHPNSLHTLWHAVQQLVANILNKECHSCQFQSTAAGVC